MFIKFPCGCKFLVKDTSYADNMVQEVNYGDDLPLLDVNIREASRECPYTWEMISSGMTKGIFQLESSLGRQWSAEIKPSNIEDLGAIGALLRPGCLNVYTGDPPKSMTKHYADRKNGLENVEYLHPKLEEILGKTYGILAYQEQSMRIATELAGFNEQEADILRKAIGKKKPEIMAKVEKEFMTKAKEAGIISDDEAKEIFAWIKESQNYSFNKSHSVSYAINGYWTAFIKAHFPLTFYCIWLRKADLKPKPFIEVYELVNEAKRMDIDIMLPDFRDLKPDFYIKNGKVYTGLCNLRGVGKNSFNKIKRNIEQEGLNLHTLTWMDYLLSCTKFVSATATKAFINTGALSYMGISRARMLYEFKTYSELTDKEIEWIEANKPWKNLAEALEAGASIKSKGGAAANKNRAQILEDLATMLDHPPHKLEDVPEVIASNEKYYIGASITCSPVDGYDKSMHANCTCKDFLNNPRTSTAVILAVQIESVRIIKTKRGKNPGQEMAFLSVSDSSGSIEDVIIWPEAYSKLKNHIFVENLVLMQGRRNDKGNGLIVEKVWPI